MVITGKYQVITTPVFAGLPVTKAHFSHPRNYQKLPELPDPLPVYHPKITNLFLYYVMLLNVDGVPAATSPRVTASHSNSAVKLGRAVVVLSSGRGLEGTVLQVFYAQILFASRRCSLHELW